MGEGPGTQVPNAGVPNAGVANAGVANAGVANAGVPNAGVVVRDRRPGDRRLRVSWHPESSTFVFSHWVEGLCVASTPVTVADAAAVAEFLADSLRLEASPTAAEWARGERRGGAA